MNTSDNKEQELLRKEQEIRERELELKLRELELDIQEQEPDLYATEKHNPPPNSWQIFRKKLTKVAKFLGFALGTIVLIRLGFLIGMWIAYAILALGIIFISYQIFLGNDE